MPSHLSPSARPSSVPWGLALAALSVLLVGGGLIVWAHQDPVVPQTASVDAPHSPPFVSAAADVSDLSPFAPAKFRPTDALAAPVGLFSITLTHEHGVRVVKIQVVAGGDEIVVDAATGRVIETRPGPALPPRAALFSSAT